MDTSKFNSQRVTLVTHVYPDIDALLGTWILVRFGGIAAFDLVFVPVGKKLEGGKNVIHIDTGLVDFDHHNSDEFTCAAKLVYDKVFRDTRDSAVEALVNYALKTDWYLVQDNESSPFALNSAIEGLNLAYPSDPHRVARVVFELLDALYKSLSTRISAETEYSRGRKFDSRWGQGFAIESDLPGVREVAYRNGANIFVFVDPEKGYRGFKARSQAGIKFGSLYKSVKEIEPDADWFLHSSGELLLCGSDKAPDRKLSRLPLGRLVALASNVGTLPVPDQQSQEPEAAAHSAV